VISGSLGARERDADVSRMVLAKSVFLAQGNEVSASRRWAWESMARKRWRHPRTKSQDTVADESKLWRNRLKIGKAWGTTRAWQAPVLRMVAKTCSILA